MWVKTVSGLSTAELVMRFPGLGNGYQVSCDDPTERNDQVGLRNSADTNIFATHVAGSIHIQSHIYIYVCTFKCGYEKDAAYKPQTYMYIYIYTYYDSLFSG